MSGKEFSLIKFLWELKIKQFLQRNYEVLSSHYFLLLVHYLLFPPTFLFGTSSPLAWSQASGKNFQGIRASGNMLFAFWVRSLPFLKISPLNQTTEFDNFCSYLPETTDLFFYLSFLFSFLLKGTGSELPPISGLFRPSEVAKSSPHSVNFANMLTFLPFQCHYKHSNCLRLHCSSKQFYTIDVTSELFTIHSLVTSWLGNLTFSATSWKQEFCSINK